MKVLKLLMLVLFAASLTTLLPATLHATDHPWDDSTIDSSTVTGAQGDVGHQPNPDANEPPIIIKAKILIIDLLRGLFSLGVSNDEEVAIGNANPANRIDGRFNWRKYKADIY